MTDAEQQPAVGAHRQASPTAIPRRPAGEANGTIGFQSGDCTNPPTQDSPS